MVEFITDALIKEKVAEKILGSLPEWFGLPDSTKKYISDSKNMPFWAFFIRALALKNWRSFLDCGMNGIPAKSI